MRFPSLPFAVLAALTVLPIFAAPVQNASFEHDILTGWQVTQGNVERIAADDVKAAEGQYALDLNGDQPGAIAQTVRGLKPHHDYTLRFAYADQKVRANQPDIIASAEVHANGQLITTLRNTSDAPAYIDGIGFLVQPNAAGELRLEFRSTQPGPHGLVIDHVRLTEGAPAAMPEGPAIANASFEDVLPENFGVNPHLFGHQLPGWLILRENVDVITYERFGAPHGNALIDLGGHGPGGIGQVITGLEPGARYRFSLLHTRHQSWNQVDDLTAEVYLNGTLAMSLVRDQNQKAPRWEKVSYAFTAPADGQLTLEMYSTSLTVGGGVLFDDLRLEKISAMTKTTPIRVLIIDGFSNHDWPRNTTYLKQILETDGRFAVEVSTCPSRTADASAWQAWAPRFTDYPVIIQTTNDINQSDVGWPASVQRALEAYLQHGGGMFAYHSANNAFPDWPEYNRMIGLGWRAADFGPALTVTADGETIVVPAGEGEKTGHGKRRSVLSTRLGDHAIHRGLPRTWLAAELEVYRYARGPAEQLEVLAHGQDEKTGLNFPIEWTVRYGEGKIYSGTYGHLWHNQTEPDGLSCVAFQTLLVRALQWLSDQEIDHDSPLDFPTDTAPSLGELRL
jgi:type 1 glutamine amidotransferase